LGTYNLLNSCLKYWENTQINNRDNFRLIYVSTDEVYGSLNNSDNPFTENNNYSPNSPYSASKAAGDHLVRSWFKTYSLPAIITNTSNNYGPWQFPEKLIPLTIKKCLLGQNIPVYGNGQQIRDWIKVEDHVSGLLTVLKKGTIGEKYNIGSNCELTNIQVVKDICSILDKIKPNSQKSYEELITFVDDRPGHDKRYSIDNNKVLKIGWKPKFSWKDGIENTVTWYLDNEDFLNNDLNYSGERLGKL